MDTSPTSLPRELSAAVTVTVLLPSRCCRLSGKTLMVKSIHGYSAPEATRHNSAPELMDTGPAVALLSNGRYSVMLTAAGAGWATWQDFDVTRWREDATRDCWGQFCYVRDLASNALWSIGRQPVFSTRKSSTSTVSMVTGPNSAVAPKTSKFLGRYVSHQMSMRKFVR